MSLVSNPGENAEDIQSNIRSQLEPLREIPLNMLGLNLDALTENLAKQAEMEKMADPVVVFANGCPLVVDRSNIIGGIAKRGPGLDVKCISIIQYVDNRRLKGWRELEERPAETHWH